MAVATIDWTFRVSDIFAVVGFCIGGVSGALILQRMIDKLTGRMDLLEQKVDVNTSETAKQSTEIAHFAELLTQMGRYEERFLSQQRQIDDLKHGRGFIDFPPIRKG